MSDSELIAQLLALMARLTEETEGYLDRQDDPQLWYNRGYANGMLKELSIHGYGEQLAGLVVADPEDYQVGQKFLPWGKAYWHGFEMGGKECREVLSDEHKPQRR